MKNKLKLVFLGICSVQLASCVMYDETEYSSYQAYSYDQTQLYPQGDYRMNSAGYSSQPKQVVAVPETYHVGEYHSPVSFKDRDRTWVNSQNPQGYTIEVGDDEHAAAVAQKLYKSPKNDRMAQIKYQRNGKEYYKGLYGSYESAEAAQKALDALPPEVKQGAGVKNWSSVQSSVNE